MVATVKFSQFANGGNFAPDDITVGLRDGTNTQFVFPSAPEGISWVVLNATSVNASVDTGYIINASSGLTTINLPFTAQIGDQIAVEGLGDDGWIIQAASGQTIRMGGVASSVAGTAASTTQWDNAYLRCIVTNTLWKLWTSITSTITLL